ncbi:hypothetical protein AZI86_08515 [Bdellovibrio bacteriovorus]|uniref:Outer membrane protein beta-barrel domain-containing protein n=1 Tax=Bdellovibrio bacteriovorus TaxID=959 RepID=A0A150WRN9_BDEBC|nr:hypothetical protein [Bdellovibrio bacteriovorus]KYG67046.1 hypothetical protein AZI86_08515 [Bdellovibrio bacteriovorus]
MKTLSMIMILLTLGTTVAFAQKKSPPPAGDRNYLVSTYLWSPTLTFGKYIHPQGIFQLEAGGNIYRDANIESRFRINANYKHYFQNFWFGSEFFLKGGVEYMKMSYSANDYSSTQNKGLGFKGDNISTIFALGHEWRKRSWVLGVDWASVRIPLTWQISDERVSTGADWEIHQLHDEESIYLKNTRFEYFHLYIGYNF